MNMVDNDKLVELRRKSLKKMYDEADPGVDYDDVKENPDDYDEDWFNNHELSSDRQSEIIYEVAEEMGIDEDVVKDISWRLLLDGPLPPEDED